jgi:hypothetical protein
MKNFLFLFVSASMLMFSSCTVLDSEEIFAEEAELKGAKKVMNFRAHLSGDQEVAVEPVVTNATGQAIFQLSKDGTELSYKLIVANIEDVRMAHIHLAPAGANGPVVAWLYPSAPPALPIPGKFNGILAEGTITEANLVGPLVGMSFSSLIDAMKAGDTYVNVHTDAYPPGEIRGQIYGN